MYAILVSVQLGSRAVRKSSHHRIVVPQTAPKAKSTLLLGSTPPPPSLIHLRWLRLLRGKKNPLSSRLQREVDQQEHAQRSWCFVSSCYIMLHLYYHIYHMYNSMIHDSCVMYPLATYAVPMRAQKFRQVIPRLNGQNCSTCKGVGSE